MSITSTLPLLFSSSILPRISCSYRSSPRRTISSFGKRGWAIGTLAFLSLGRDLRPRPMRHGIVTDPALVGGLGGKLVARVRGEADAVHGRAVVERAVHREHRKDEHVPGLEIGGEPATPKLLAYC